MATVIHWITAFRLRTLPLAASSILMGTFLAIHHNVFRWQVFLWSMLTTLFLQILSNLANDYGDALSGVDGNHRSGPRRMVETGLISAASMKQMLYVFIVLSFVSGLILLYVSSQNSLSIFFTFLFFGVLAILAAIFYTVGKRPYGYLGLGDLSVLIFFGFLGVGGSYFLNSLQWNWVVIYPALTSGLLATGVLNVNNLRDIESDSISGKNSIPVRLGHKKGVGYHTLLICGSIASFVVYIIISGHYLAVLYLTILPFLVRHMYQVSQLKGKELDPLLKQLAITSLVGVLLFGLSLFF